MPVWGHDGNTIRYGSAMIYDFSSHAVIAVLLNDNSRKQLTVAEELLLTIVDYLDGIKDNIFNLSVFPVMISLANTAIRNEWFERIYNIKI